MMESRPNKEFGKRGPIAPQPVVPPKRSGHVALLLMGTLAVGGGAYALMPRGNCPPPAPGAASPAIAPSGNDCPPRSSSSTGSHGGWGGTWSHSNFYSSDSSSSNRTSPGTSSSGTSSDSGSGSVARGGFGSFARAFSVHFSTGG